MLQTVIVTVIVLASAGYALWQLATPAARLRAVTAFEKQFGSLAASRWLRVRALAAMSGCSSCEANTKSPAKSPQARSAQ